VRGTVLGSPVGLDLDDPSDPAGSPTLAYEQRSEQAGRRLDDGTREQPGEVAGGPQRYVSRRSDGTIHPKSTKKSGMSEARNRSTTWDEL